MIGVTKGVDVYRETVASYLCVGVEHHNGSIRDVKLAPAKSFWKLSYLG